jgi:hypothetical protein
MKRGKQERSCVNWKPGTSAFLRFDGGSAAHRSRDGDYGSLRRSSSRRHGFPRSKLRPCHHRPVLVLVRSTASGERSAEKLIEKHNAKWKLGGGVGIHPRSLSDMALAGFRSLETFSFDLDVPYSHEAWRGRIRASAGVGASLSPEGVAAFDRGPTSVAPEKFPQEPLAVLHRVFAAIGKAPE